MKNDNLKAFIFYDKSNRFYFLSAIGSGAILWILFKYFYPYPNMVLDSYYYVRAAALHLPVNAWPIGYSKFLEGFGFFSHSAYLLTTVQYIFLELSCLFFFFTWKYLFNPGRAITVMVFIFLFFNPLLFYCSNYIMSDVLFIGLSLLWVCQLLWIIFRFKPYMIITHAVVIFIVFTVRYNALYYPVISALAILLSKQRTRYVIMGIALPFLLIFLFILYCGNQTASITGVWQFSPFGGWKLANDALYAYAHVEKRSGDNVPLRYKSLDDQVRAYFTEGNDSLDLLVPDFSSGSYFMFSPNSPLVRYIGIQKGEELAFLNSKRWLAVAPLYEGYGMYLIRQYPMAFARYFLLPNLVRYVMPVNENMGSHLPFYLHDPDNGVYVKKFFGLTNITVAAALIDLNVKIFSPVPRIFAFFHFLFIVGAAGFLFYGGKRKTGKALFNCIVLILSLWLCDLCFSVISAGIVLRYEIFMMIPEVSFGLYFIETIYHQLDKE